MISVAAVSLEGAHGPVALFLLAVVRQPRALTVSHASFEVAPEGTLLIDVATPAVETVILQLSLVNEVLHLTTNSMQLTLRIHLSKATLIVIFGGSHVEVNRIARSSISNNISGVENTMLLPFGESNAEVFLVLQSLDKARVVAWLRLKYLDKLIGKGRSRRSSDCSGLRNRHVRSRRSLRLVYLRLLHLLLLRTLHDFAALRTGHTLLAKRRTGAVANALSTNG